MGQGDREMLLCEDVAFEIECKEWEFFCTETVQIWVILLHQPVCPVVELHNAEWFYFGERASEANWFVRVSSEEQQVNFS